MTHKLTKDEAQVIRQCARDEAGSARILIEAGKRCLLDGPYKPNVNIRLVTNDPDWDDTDLDNQVDWQSFRRDGFEFASGGRALVDFYVSTTGMWGELKGNVVAQWENGTLVSVTGTMGNILWSKDEG